jgi:hypothetical protein
MQNASSCRQHVANRLAALGSTGHSQKRLMCGRIEPSTHPFLPSSPLPQHSFPTIFLPHPSPLFLAHSTAFLPPPPRLPTFLSRGRFKRMWTALHYARPGSDREHCFKRISSAGVVSSAAAAAATHALPSRRCWWPTQRPATLRASPVPSIARRRGRWGRLCRR